MTRSYTWIWEKTREAELSELIGKTLSKIEINVDKTEIFFTTEEGNQYLMYHSQNCCESVQLEEVHGDFSDLVGSPILQAEEVTNHDMFNGKPECPDSWTWTFYKLATVKGYVTLRWLGESNGYYSESVDFAEIKDTNANDVRKDIERLVRKYPWPDSTDLFRAELEGLAEIAMAEGERECRKVGFNLIEVDSIEMVRAQIGIAESQNHVQQVAYSTHHDALTQIDFTTKTITTNMKGNHAE